ncbi:MAG TPA: non-ribosomal peptide synthetase [Steroidobacteraceae bacterium]|nr:non-ribosomal peptide synthetase [Steroidobacteraceae bacterium]
MLTAAQQTIALPLTIGERFAEVARCHAARLAVRDARRACSYAELAAEVTRIAEGVRAIAPGNGPVAIILRNEARFTAAVLGVLTAGRICVPLDATHPLERNSRILTHAGAAALISTAELAEPLRALLPGGMPMLDLDAKDWCVRAAADRVPAPDDIACILYTSGSTGTPKGVFQNQLGVLKDVSESASVGPLTPADHVAIFYAPAVIAGLRTLLAGILSGAALEVLPPLELGAPALVREIVSRGVTRLNLSPTLFRHLINALAPGERLGSVRTVMLGGERIGWGDVDLFQRGCAADAALYVHLGATECWTVHTQWRVDDSLRESCATLPVGRAVPERLTRIVDENDRPLPDGATGEILVISRYMALGYWREPNLTAQAFGIDAADPTLRSYRTGDLARRRPDGLLEFAGRKDQQIKLHGYRIEPSEVESALKACPGVSDAAVLVRNNAAGVPVALVGYAQLKAGERTLLPRHLLAMLSRRVPAYMTPAEIVLLDELPWLPNFKIDRQRLAQLDAARAQSQPQPARSQLLRELIEIFQRVTHVSGATPEDNVLSLGGDSLQTLEIALEIGRRYDIEVPECEGDATRTIAEWAREVARWRASRDALSVSEL